MRSLTSPSGRMKEQMATETHTSPSPVSMLPLKADGGANGPVKLVRRACDCCRKRKVRCDGLDPCGPCKKASIRCAYLQPPKKKGPKGLRSARVLHALRKIDDTASAAHVDASSTQEHFGNWQWSTSGGPAAPGVPYQNDPSNLDSASSHRGPSDLRTETQPFYQQISNATPLQQTQPSQPVFKREHQPQYSWSSAQTDAGSLESECFPQVLSPTSSESYTHRVVSGETFAPYVQLFFNHMFAIMPVIDQRTYLDPNLYSPGSILTPVMYCFLSALCAATVVQLDDSIPQPPSPLQARKADQLFADECLRERRTFDYVETMSPLSIMTSFFLFAYFGNHERHMQAWHYLQESITFAENLEMDDEASYAELDPAESQWRRRLYWLLFITERAYAVQRRKHTRLHASVALPAVFESEDPQLLTGFVNLANLFSAVDESFVSAWRGSRRCDEAWLAQTQKQLDETAHAAGLGELTETQHLDIGVTREWLHVLAWQMGVSNGLIWGQGEGGMRLDYPVTLARKVVEIVAPATAISLDSHGIGMEQKLSDIAGCLADVLKCTAGDTSATFAEGKQYLDILLNKLSSMRGKESRYLKPLMTKMEGLLGYEVNTSIPLLADSREQWSMNESVSMLRTLSMTGTLGMPGIVEDWAQRRPSGRVLEEHELEALQPWLNPGTPQPVA